MATPRERVSDECLTATFWAVPPLPPERPARRLNFGTEEPIEPNVWAVILLAAFVGAPLVAGSVLRLFPTSTLLPISSSTIASQVVLVLGTWTLLLVMPETDGLSESCPDWDTGYGAVLKAAAFASLGVGAVACASSVLAYRRKLASGGRWWAGLASEGLIVAIWVPLIAASLCGLN